MCPATCATPLRGNRLLRFCSLHPFCVTSQQILRAMYSVRTMAVLALVALSASRISAQTCPLPAGAEPDFSGLVASCSNNATICTDCLCSLTTALVPAFVAGGVTYDPQNPTNIDMSKITEISTACAQALAPQIAAALGSKATALAGLVGCPLVADSAAGKLTAASLPSCLNVQTLSAAFAAANATNATLNGTASSTSTAATTDVTMDMTNSTTSGDNTTSVVATQGPAVSTASTPAASPAAAPATKAPGNSAAIAGMTAMTTIGAAALAALLL